MIVASKRLGLAWFPRRLEAGAVVAFALVFAMLVLYGKPGLGLGQLFFVPILLMALAGGRRAGIVAGAIASILYVAALVLRAPWTPETIVSMRSVIHFASYVVAGAIAGTFAGRARGLLGESLHMLDVLLAVARRDIESGAASAQGLDAAVAQRVARAWPFALLVGELEPAPEERKRAPAEDGGAEVREAVRMLSRHFGPGGEVARTGPTRLVVLSSATSPTQARDVASAAERVLDEGGRRATFGWAWYPTEGADGLSLLQSASERLYARRIVRGEWSPTAASAGLVEELPARRAASSS